jgi:glycolate oxidase iron-sulfur subunit
VPRPGGATLGGVLAAGQSGMDRLRHGPARHHVLGMRVVLAGGGVAKSGGRLVKNVTGYDMHRLYCGSHGTLCVIVEASMRLAAAPERERVVTAGARDRAEALEKARAALALDLQPLSVRAENVLDPRGAWRVHVLLSGRAGFVEWASDRALEAIPGAAADAETIERVRDAELAGGAWPRLRLAGRPSRVAAALAALDPGARMVVEPSIALVELLDPREGLAREMAGARPGGRRARRLGDFRARQRDRAAAEERARSARRLRDRAPVGDTLSMGPANARELVDYAASLDCIHCGLCVSSCPTWKLTGVESSSPRGRIHLMRAVAEGELEPDADYVEEMEFCLLCRHCESVCPSGVRFGAMMEIARDGITREIGRPLRSRLARWLGFRVLLPHPALLRAAAALARFAQKTGLQRLVAPNLAAPAIPPARERAPLPARTAARGERRGEVAVLEGCVMPLLYGRVNRATLAVLARCGFDVACPEPRTCCGSLHAHNGDLEGARALAKRTIEAFETVPGEIVVNSAGCSAHLKDYGHLLEPDEAWRERARRLAGRVRDLSEFLAGDRAAAGLAAARARAAPRAVAGTVAYDDPCHLCHGQGIRAQPRALLDAIRGCAASRCAAASRAAARPGSTPSCAPPRAPRCSSRRSARSSRAAPRRSSRRTPAARCSGRPASPAPASTCASRTSPRSCANRSATSGQRSGPTWNGFRISRISSSATGSVPFIRWNCTRSIPSRPSGVRSTNAMLPNPGALPRGSSC